MTGILLYIRYKQLQRQLQKAGLYSFFFLGVLIFLVFKAYQAFQRTPDAYYLTGVLLLLCIGLHNWRRDSLFVFRHVEKPFREIYAEYAALVFPFAFTSLFTANWYCFPVLLIMLGIVPYLKFSAQNRVYLKNISAVIPAAHFEAISGVRKNMQVLFPLYLMALVFSWVKVVPLLLLAFITINVVTFFQECESLQILTEGNKTPAGFLKEKLKVYSGYVLLLYCPVLLLNFLFQKHHWLIYAGFLVCQVSIVCFSILLKYRNYQPKETLFANTLLLTLVSLAAIIPVFIAVPVFLCVAYYRKALSNLSFYLND